MGVVDRRLELVENILRLRRVGRALPGDHDVAAVRGALERELGETVSGRLAARVLGVSHTALQRWVASGDLPVVYTRGGRWEVPVAALLELRESVDADRIRGVSRNPLAATMARRREAADRIRAADLQVDRMRGAGHGRARARGLAYHRVVARRLTRAMVAEAREVLSRWRDQGRIAPEYADGWERLLERPVSEIREALIDETAEADDLRQNSPFAGLLSEPERRRILDEVR